jgi:hypothetical protein
VDAIHGDKTEMDIMGPWGVYFGMCKKMGDVRFVPVAPDEFEMTATRRGTRLVTLRMRFGAELSKAAVEQLRATAAWPDQLTVRAIPDPSYTHFAEHSVCRIPTAHGNRIDRMWNATVLDLKLGHLDMDPLDELPVLELTGAFAAMNTTEKSVFTELQVVDNLLVPQAMQIAAE